MTTKNYISPEIDIFKFAAEAGFQDSTIASGTGTSAFTTNNSDNDADAWE